MSRQSVKANASALQNPQLMRFASTEPLCHRCLQQSENRAFYQGSAMFARLFGYSLEARALVVKLPEESRLLKKKRIKLTVIIVDLRSLGKYCRILRSVFS